MAEKIAVTTLRGPAELIGEWQQLCKARDLTMSQRMRQLIREEVRAARATGELPVGVGPAVRRPAHDGGC